MHSGLVKSGDIVDLAISSLGVNGEGVAKLDGYTVFVDGALPNESVSAKINLIKPSYAKGVLLSIKHADENRVTPACARYEDCGGCQIMHLSYAAQLARKTQLVKDALKHIGALPDAVVLPAIASPEPFHYRNKIQLPVAKADGAVVTGFYRRGSHDIVPYDRCMAHHPSMEETVLRIRTLLQSSQVEPYNEASGKGTLRHFIIRANGKGEQLIGLVTTGRQNAAVSFLAKEIQRSIENVVGVLESINKKAQNVILGDKTILLAGTAFLLEELEGLTFKISLPSFFQVNLNTAKLLYRTALSFAEIDNNSRVLDAYCGIGTMSLMAATLAKHVIGTECVPQAVRDAQENARLNKLSNAKFVVGKVEENVHLFKDIDIALINPPRKGLDSRVTDAIDEFGPKRLVYVSCNPATLARDVRLLKSYKLLKVQPVDMFPQTMHVESVALLERC